MEVRKFVWKEVQQEGRKYRIKSEGIMEVGRLERS